MPGKQKQIKKKRASKSKTEDWFETILNSSEGKGLPAHEREYVFHPTRKWRFDFAWPKPKLGLEIHGSIYTQGRHTRGAGMEADMEKHNEAALLGWRILYFSTGQIKRQPVQCLDIIKRAILREGA